jgi:PIN like domain
LLPEDFVLYLDENLHNCKPILEALVQRGVKHERHTQHFQPGTEDAEWLPFVGQRGWILLTKDKRIRFNQLEKAAIRRFHVRGFTFRRETSPEQRWPKYWLLLYPRWRKSAGSMSRHSSRVSQNQGRSVCDSSKVIPVEISSNPALLFWHLHICKTITGGAV